MTGPSFVAIIDDRMVNELRAVVDELGGEHTLGRPLSNERDMREAIREGRWAAFRDFCLTRFVSKAK